MKNMFNNNKIRREIEIVLMRFKINFYDSEISLNLDKAVTDMEEVFREFASQVKHES